MLPLSPALLSFSILAFASVILAQTLTFTWPKYPEAYVSFPLTWSGGTPPVRLPYPTFLNSITQAHFLIHSTLFTCLLRMYVPFLAL